MSKSSKFFQQHHKLPFYSRKNIKLSILNPRISDPHQNSNNLGLDTDGSFNHDYSPIVGDRDGAVINESWDASSISDQDDYIPFILSESDNNDADENEINRSGSSDGSFRNNMDMGFIHPQISLSASDSVYMLKALESRHGFTKAATVDVFKLIRMHLPESANYPTTYHEAQKLHGNENEFVRHYFCEKCMVQISESENCNICGYNVIEAKKYGHYFISFNIENKFKTLLSQESICSALSESMEKRQLAGSDFNMRSMYSDLKLDSYDITCTFNTDGVPVFASSNSSLWPVLISLNELPILLRKRNIIVAGIWFGSKQPNMKLFLPPIVKNMNRLSEISFNWKHQTLNYCSRIYFTVCSVDALARCKLQGIKQFNGICGCNWCIHPGVSVEKGRGYCRVYPYTKFPERSNDKFRQSISNKQLSDGIISLSPLLQLRKFNIVQGFSVDYMHCILLGCARTFTYLWLNTKKQKYYIGDKINLINERILNTKVTKEIVRATRGIHNCKHWKASEWRTWLFILPVILNKILPKIYLDHFSILSECTFTLNKLRPSAKDINKCETKLIKFVKDVEALYGQKYVSFNVHQLTHLCKCVRTLGPLWETSAFSFESMNGVILKYIKSSNGVLLQIARKINQDFFIHNPTEKIGELKTAFRQTVFNKQINPKYVILNPLLVMNVPNYVQQGIRNYTFVKTFYASKAAIIQGFNFKVEDSKKRTNNIIVLQDGLFGEIVTFYHVDCVCQFTCQCYHNFVLVKVRRAVNISPLSYIYCCNLDDLEILEIYPIELVKSEKCMKYTDSKIVNYIKLPNLIDAE